jgi:hypothetical protein
LYAASSRVGRGAIMQRIARQTSTDSPVCVCGHRGRAARLLCGTSTGQRSHAPLSPLDKTPAWKTLVYGCFYVRVWCALL